MKAAEFIAKFGFNVAEKCLKNCFSPNDKWFIHEGELVSNNEFDLLKTYVDAWDLVQKMGSTIDEIKEHVRVTERNLERGVYFKCTIERNINRINRIKKAIALVEEVESLKEVC